MNTRQSLQNILSIPAFEGETPDVGMTEASDARGLDAVMWLLRCSRDDEWIEQVDEPESAT